MHFRSPVHSSSQCPCQNVKEQHRLLLISPTLGAMSTVGTVQHLGYLQLGKMKSLCIVRDGKPGLRSTAGSLAERAERSPLAVQHAPQVGARSRPPCTPRSPGKDRQSRKSAGPPSGFWRLLCIYFLKTFSVWTLRLPGFRTGTTCPDPGSRRSLPEILILHGHRFDKLWSSEQR